MSYILDALRKSDQLRQRGAAPTLLLAQTPVAATQKPTPLYYGLLALIVLLAGIAIGWLRPWQPQPAPVDSIAKLTEPGTSPAPALRPEIKPKPQAQAQDTESAAPAVSAPALKQAPNTAGAEIAKPRRAPPKVVAKAKKKAAPLPEPSAGSGTAAPLPSVMAMSELPLAIQQELPFMSISVHAYSDKAADRLVGINDRLLHEGEEVAPGLVLENITPLGMILSYKGYNFHRGVH